MFIEAFLFVVGAGATMAAGIPMAVRLARAGLEDDVDSGRPAAFSRDGGATAGFTPLDLGPDPMTWPSAKPWPISTRLPEAEWPSRSWNDEHFGRHWREAPAQGQTAEATQAAAREAREAAAEAREAAKQARRDQRAAREQSESQRKERDATQARLTQQAQLAREEQQRKVEQARKQEAARQSQADAQRREAARRELAKRQANRAPTPQTPAPSREELLALVEKIGLAGTVQEIMKRTGWDFRKAAQYLAQVRSGR